MGRMRVAWKSFVEFTRHPLGAAIALAIAGAVASLFRPVREAAVKVLTSLPLQSWLFGAGGLVVGGGVAALLARRRPAAPAAAVVTPAACRSVKVVVRDFATDPAGTRRRTLEAEVLEGKDAKRMAEGAFTRGAHRLRDQIRPMLPAVDVMVGVNSGGVAIAALVGGNDGCPLGVAHLGGSSHGRHVERLDLPTPLAKPEARCHVLLVDIQMKSAYSLELVKDALVARGFAADRIWAAVLVLANLEAVPEGGEAFALSPVHFPQRAYTKPETYEPWLGRTVSVAYVAEGSPKPFWQLWDEGHA